MPAVSLPPAEPAAAAEHVDGEEGRDEPVDSPSAEPAEPPPLAGEVVAFTGTLASMTHAAAARLVDDLGGTFTEHLTRGTTLLVVGEEGWPLADDGAPTVKFRHAAEWNRTGEATVRLLAESDWLRLAGLSSPLGGDLAAGVRRLYTPAMLSGLLDVTPGRIRSWARDGLIRPVKTVHRLPYFDFAEVARTRTLAKLLAAGVSKADLAAGLSALSEVFGEEAVAAGRLDLLARDGRLLIRDDAGLREPATGQRVLEFAPDDPHRTGDAPDEPPSPALLRLPDPDGGRAARRSAAEWLRLGVERLDADDPAAAEPALRACLAKEPTHPEAHFHLADALFRTGRPDAAAERYRAATEHDPRYLEAWVQLGCVRASGGEHRSAAAAFRTALEIHGDLPEAHFHLAESLHALGDEGAEPHYRAYLAHDDRGPWAQLARARLKMTNDLR
ncbi:tetratricopeptide repeat protein [Alienimonas californiensis]|uniref:DNA polymerase III subunit epsilon n=1 Tax=Alienimonas californiensis TaxID=2527989 RepID=A0A517PES2_9PLAN|nr:tetratricopeptide repeat protein [Alienimonas californiensis]QDT17872.1 DNA polymerase III subunit epsilon [Alienimonas californiensis]